MFVARGVRRYPDPDSVPAPSIFPPKYVPQLTSEDAGPGLPIHNHEAFVDRNGNGATTSAAGHTHRVQGGRVLATDGHIHHLTGLPSGAG